MKLLLKSRLDNTTGTISGDLEALSAGRWPTATRRALSKRIGNVAFLGLLALLMGGFCWGAAALLHHFVLPSLGVAVWTGIVVVALGMFWLGLVCVSNWQMRH